MKSNTTTQYLYTGDLYGYVLVTSEDGTVTQKNYDVVPTQVRMQLTTNLFGELIIHSLSKMQKNAYVKNIVDANGEQIYVDGVWEIVQTAPILGPLGIKAGYQYRAILISGDI